MLLKIKLIKQDNAGHLFYFVYLTNKTKTKTHTHTHTQKKRQEKEKSFNQSYDQWDAISLIT